MATGRRVWQISGGPASRSYADVFLRYGVALIGPGYAGRWERGKPDGPFEGPYTRCLAEEVAVGDIFLLRTSISQVVAIGLVASEYLFLDQFDDVNGWDLRQGRRVRWCCLPSPYDFRTPVFGANPPRLSRVHSEPVVQFAESNTNSPPDSWKTAELPDLPPPEPLLTEIPQDLSFAIASIQDLGAFYRDREALPKPPSEAEIVAHCVVAFLEALGWRRFHIAVEWNNVDVAVFSDLPRVAENCRFVVEAKAFNEGIESASAQAKNYLDQLGIHRDLVVTDGFRYKMYAASDIARPVAYANLWEPKQSALALFDRMRRQSHA
jgi:hypothetical protein